MCVRQKRTEGSNPSLSASLFKDMAFTYVIFSIIRNQTYVGCSNDWASRLDEHNAGKVKSTNSGRPWNVALVEEHSTMLDARRRERYLKSSAGRRWLKNKLGDLSSSTPARPDQIVPIRSSRSDRDGESVPASPASSVGGCMSKAYRPPEGEVFKGFESSRPRPAGTGSLSASLGIFRSHR